MEVVPDEDGRSVRAVGSVRRSGVPRPMVLVVAALVAVGSLWWSRGDPPRGGAEADPAVDGPVTTAPGAEPSSPPPSAPGVLVLPPPLMAAERYVADPGPDTLRVLVASIGGLDAVALGEATGAFDLVRFDPLDPDRLLASLRSSYGPADNSAHNQVWLLGDDGLSQAPWAPDAIHDFAHFNVDGTITMWRRPGEDVDFGPREALVLANDGVPLAASVPLYASRFTSAGGTVFALLGDGNYYTRDHTFRALVADDGSGAVPLDGGADYGWIDNPTPELLVAYPRHDDALTAVWDTATLARLDDHPLAGRPYRRVAVSGDGRTAVGVRFDGRMEQLELARGVRLSVFGSIDPWGVDQPLTVGHDGRTVVTVERSGRVTLWWAGADRPVATVAADAAQPRWVSEPYGARSTSVVAPGARRLALRRPGRPGIPVSWVVVDTSPQAMVERACQLAGRAMAPAERSALGLSDSTAACR